MTEPLSQETKDTLDQMCQGVRDACLTAVLMEIDKELNLWDYGTHPHAAVASARSRIIQRFEEMKRP